MPIKNHKKEKNIFTLYLCFKNIVRKKKKEKAIILAWLFRR